MIKTELCRVVGAMSGTSLDGVDAAEIVTDGHLVYEFGPTTFHPYTDDQRAVLKDALGKWPDDNVDAASDLIEQVHIEVLSKFPKAEMVGFHGQTLAHDPRGDRTHQAGDGAVLAQALQKTVIWDFRTSDLRMGGEGAPLAPFYHFALVKHMNVSDPTVILNLGGVGNITWVDPSLAHPEDEGALLAFDTGPANAPLNDLMMERTGKAFDADGAMAAKGVVNDQIIEDFLNHPYFFREAPKSLDRNAFTDLVAAVADLSTEDAAATLTMACAASVAAGLEQCPVPPDRLLITGGGRKNKTLMSMISDKAKVAVQPIEDAGFDGDMLEAQAFAFLAVRVANGLPTTAPSTTGVPINTGGGNISRPLSE